MQAFIEGLFPNYQYVQSLGEGKLTGTCKVIDNTNGQELCVKLIYIKGISEDNLKSMVKMVQRLSNINSPYIVKIVNSAYNNDKSHFIIVSEFMKGGNLRDEIVKHINHKKVILEDEVWEYIFQITNGIKALHDNKIIHSDLKSSNIFFTEDKKQIKIGDISIRKYLDGEKQNLFNGCPYAMSPESFRGKFCKKSDIWSLGCVIYEMAAQTPPFWSNDLEDLRKKVDNARIPKIINVSKHLIYLVESLLNPNIGNRPELKNIMRYATSAQFKSSNLDKILFPKKNLQKGSQLSISTISTNTYSLNKSINNNSSFLPKINDFQDFKLPQATSTANGLNNLEYQVKHQYKPQPLKLKRNSLIKSPTLGSLFLQKKNFNDDTQDLLNNSIVGHGYDQNTNRLKEDNTKDSTITLNQSITQSIEPKQISQIYSPKPLIINKNQFKAKRKSQNEIAQLNFEQQHMQKLEQAKKIQLQQKKSVPKDLCSNLILSRKYNYSQNLDGYRKKVQEERQIVFMIDVARVVQQKSNSVTSPINQIPK